MKRQLVLTSALALLVCGAFSSAALAVFDLQITEMWPGQAGTDVTVDWFEVTNYGDTAWVSGVDLVLYADDGPAVFANAQPISGITNILPGESAIVLMEADATDKTNFFNVWNPVKPQILDNLGIVDGSGLGMGQPADGAWMFLSDGSLLDNELYTGSTTAQSWDVVLGAYSTVGNASGAVATLAMGGDGDTPAIGSPGMVAPEPGSVALMLMGAFIFTLRHRFG